MNVCIPNARYSSIFINSSFPLFESSKPFSDYQNPYEVELKKNLVRIPNLKSRNGWSEDEALREVVPAVNIAASSGERKTQENENQKQNLFHLFGAVYTREKINNIVLVMCVFVSFFLLKKVQMAKHKNCVTKKKRQNITKISYVREVYLTCDPNMFRN